MDYKSEIMNIRSRRAIDGIVLTVYDNIQNFDTLFDLIFEPDKNLAWKTAWVCEKVVEKFPELLDISKTEKIILLLLSTNHDGLRRLLLSIIIKVQNADNIPVRLINVCFDWMISSKQPIAVQALSLKLLTNYCLFEPDLKPELIAYLENYHSDFSTPAMISSSRNCYKILTKK
jgi:hypothetical protein